MASLWTWSVEDVGRWLCSINMTHLVHKFEMASVTGEVLSKMEEGFIPVTLKINPGEKTMLIAAIRLLKSNSYKASPPQPEYTSSPPYRARTHSDEKRKVKKPSMVGSHTLRMTPAEIHVTDTLDQMPPVYKYGTASELLDDQCRHSGWIRKRGGGYKNWRKRYLVLRLGYAYYYENENSGKPKGNFCLHNCSVSRCTEEDKIKQFKWVFKVVPEDPQQRTFYVAAAAKHEMERWIEVLNAEIARFNTRLISGEDEEGDYEHIYDPVYEEEDEEDDDTISGGYHEDPVYEGVKDDDDDSDDPYTRVRDELGSFSYSSHRNNDPIISPTHRSATLSTTWQMADPMKPRKGKGDAPIIPPRSAMSLMESTPGTGGGTHVPPDISHMSIEAENPYLRIMGGDSNSSPLPSHQKQPSPVVTPRSSYTVPPPAGSFPLPHPPQRMNSPTDVHIHDSRPFTQAEIEEEDPYYIRLQTLEEVLPLYCIFDNLPREDAESRLSRTGRIGTYLLRDGTHKGAKHVLSVLTTMENTKHYKLYQKEDLSFCLTEGKIFPSLSQLIEYYKQEDLPKTPGIRLSEPYHPLDH